MQQITYQHNAQGQEQWMYTLCTVHLAFFRRPIALGMKDISQLSLSHGHPKTPARGEHPRLGVEKGSMDCGQSRPAHSFCCGPVILSTVLMILAKR